MAKNGPILLVDDDKDECELIDEALKQLKISNKLECFSNGREAFDFFRPAGGVSRMRRMDNSFKCCKKMVSTW